MSLINKMLQDLDARGGGSPAAAGASAEVRAVALPSRSRSTYLAAGLGVAALAAAGAGYFAWPHFRAPSHASAPAATSASGSVTAAATPPSRPIIGATPAAAGAPATAAASVAAPAAAATASDAPRAPDGSGSPRAPNIDSAHHPAAKSARAGEAPVSADVAAAASGATHRLAASAEKASRPEVATGSGGAATSNAESSGRLPASTAKPMRERGARDGAGAGKSSAERLRGGEKPASADKPAVARGPAAVAATRGLEAEATSTLNSQQRAENEYRRALQALHDARVSDAIASLEQAVYLYPRHEAARQTLIGLLVERKQYAEAIRHLQFAVGLDPRQSNMVMLLARLQGEQGGPAIETLQRGLQYANGNADYRALLGGLLQRAQRHKEAIEQYSAAVQMQPGQGVWWMGLGISLQAEQRKAEARDAFVRARDSGRLSAELQTFVERKLQQLAGQ